MKRFLLLLTLIAIIQSSNAQDTIQVTPQIFQTTVFLSGAEISSKASVNLKKGSATLILKNISMSADENSLSVKCNSEITILSVSQRINFMENNTIKANILAYQKNQQNLSDQKTKLNTQLSVYLEEEELIKQNKVFKGKEKALTTEKLRSASDFYVERMIELKRIQFDLKRKIDSIDEENLIIQHQLQTLSNTKPEPKKEVLVNISVPYDMKADFMLQYIVKLSGWTPVYNLRVNSVNKPIEIDCKADVWQSTGYDWKEINMLLATANLAKTGTKPELTKWLVEYGTSSYKPIQQINQPITISVNQQNEWTISGIITSQEDGVTMPGVSVVEKGTSNGTITDLDGNFTIKVSSANAIIVVSFVGMKTKEIATNTISSKVIAMESEDLALEDVVVTGMGVKKEDKIRGYSSSTISNDDESGGEANPVLAGKIGGVKVFEKRKEKYETVKLMGLNDMKVKQTIQEYKLNKPYSIFSDGKLHTVDVEKYSIDAQYKYFCVPKMDATAFLTAELTGWETLHLLDGTANFFLEGTYIGQSFLNFNNTKDTLKLSLGRDDAIYVSRERIEEFSSKQFLGNKQIAIQAFQISIRNNKPVPVNILIEDQIPVSTSGDVEVDKLELSGAKYDEKDGKLSWDIKLEPSETKKFIIKYSVKYPKNMKLNLE